MRQHLTLYLEILSKDHVLIMKETFDQKGAYISEVVREDIAVPGSDDAIPEDDESFLLRARNEMCDQFAALVRMNSYIDDCEWRRITYDKETK